MTLPADLGDGAVLRRYTMADLDALWGAVEENRERLDLWMPWVSSTRSREDQSGWLARVSGNEQLDGCGVFVGDELAGGVGMSWDDFRITGEIGYWMRDRFEGRGLVTRAVSALLDMAFGPVGLHRVCIRAGVENVRSRAIPERLGFVQEGTLRGEGRGGGGFYDLVVYGMLEDEWRSRALSGDGGASG